MKNAMQLKAIIKNIAKENSISAQIVMQNYMLERFLERISLSKYRASFILKGGFLIAAMVGLDSRATMDIDATIKGIPVNEEQIMQMFKDISAINIDDSVEFEVLGISEIRESDEYSGFRVSLSANYPPMAIPLKLDVTAGDKITPREIEYKFKLITEDRTISILAYNVETILAEKLETIISRADLNTRPRDFYDVYILDKLQYKNIDIKTLKTAFYATCEKRNSIHFIECSKEILKMVIDSKIMNDRWKIYQRDFYYAKEISFMDACVSVENLINDIV